MPWDHKADDERFVKAVLESHQWVQWVANRLEAEQLWKVFAPEPVIRKRYEDRRAYRDTGDIFLNDIHRVEVRSVEGAFSERNPDSFPFEPLHVENRSAIRSKRNAWAYVYVSVIDPYDCLGLFFREAYDQLVEREVWDRRKNAPTVWMACPKSKLVTWVQLVEYLKINCGGVEGYGDEPDDVDVFAERDADAERNGR